MKATLFTTCDASGRKTGEVFIVSGNVVSIKDQHAGHVLISTVTLKGRDEPLLIKTDARYALKQLGYEIIDARSP